MKWIEAIGAPGVGKSYLLRRLLDVSRSSGIERNWVSEEELPERAVGKIKWEDCHNLKQFVLLLYSRQKLITYKKNGVQVNLVNEIYRPKEKREDYSTWNRYSDLHLKGIKRSFYPEAVETFINEGYFRLVKKYKFYEALDIDYPVYVDEGLIQNNFGINEKGGENSDKPFLVIHYKEEPETIFHRVKEKELKTGKRCAWYKGLNDIELKNYIDRVISIQEDKIKWLKRFSVPVIEMSTKIVDDDDQLLEVLFSLNKHISNHKL